MRKIICVVLAACLFLSLAGCVNLVDTKTEVVEVTIIGAEPSNTWLQPIWTGKYYTYIYHEDEAKIIVDYKNKSYTIEGNDVYNAYHSRIGDTVNATLVTETYSNDAIHTHVILTY